MATDTSISGVQGRAVGWLSTDCMVLYEALISERRHKYRLQLNIMYTKYFKRHAYHFFKDLEGDKAMCLCARTYEGEQWEKRKNPYVFNIRHVVTKRKNIPVTN
jgi:hypothetical protein